MFADREECCPAPATLRRIAAARWTPYVAETLRQWSRDALNEPAACSKNRLQECPACCALREIGKLGWETSLARQIQEKARDTIDTLSRFA